MPKALTRTKTGPDSSIISDPCTDQMSQETANDLQGVFVESIVCTGVASIVGTI